MRCKSFHGSLLKTLRYEQGKSTCELYPKTVLAKTETSNYVNNDDSNRQADTGNRILTLN
jgi:hypothetical protein